MATRQPDPDLIIISLFGGRPSAEQVEALATIHPGFRRGRSLVLHRDATDPAYALWRGQLKRRGLENGLALLRTERNTPPLFGLRLIDEVPNAVIGDNARRQSREVRGRVHTLDGGSIGRFGWKAQVGTLEEFVLTACAGELGLEAPGHHQAPWPPTADPPERTPDLTAEECDALVAYVRGLPRPVEVAPKGSAQAADAAAGRRLFTEIGCAECHTPSLGTLEGVYSDLLLHDMGEGLADHGNYYGNDDTAGAANTEWRTPPLWGFRDSGPYLHDGRARHLTEAVASHEGQAAASARRFRHLSPREHHRVSAFLESLAAPPREPSPAPDRGRATARAEGGSYGR